MVAVVAAAVAMLVAMLVVMGLVAMLLPVVALCYSGPLRRRTHSSSSSSLHCLHCPVSLQPLACRKPLRCAACLSIASRC
jgi:hypothetical protein